MLRLAADRVLRPDGTLEPGVLVIEDGWIRAVEEAAEPPPSRLIAPGFVDLQVNGHGSIDVARATGEEWASLDQMLLAQGVTSWCPTLITAPWDQTAAALARIAEAAARPGIRPRIVGAHLEGPFLGRRHGVHDEADVVAPDRASLDRIPEVVRLVTLGPEAEGALEAIVTLRERGIVVALGHTDASYETALAAVDAGARLVTHAFNATGPLHHRQPGTLGAALTDERVAVSLIADLVHVHPAVLTVAVRATGRGRWLLVTDAVAWQHHDARAAGLDLVEGAVRRADGTLAGSALGMDGAVRRVVDAGVASLAEALLAASATPAQVMGLPDRGRIEAGCRADLVALDDALRPTATWVGGVEVWGPAPGAPDR